MAQLKAAWRYCLPLQWRSSATPSGLRCSERHADGMTFGGG
jgi:hypothetical protein